MRSSMLFSLLATVRCEDQGYLDLFHDALEEIEDAQLEVQGKIPDWLDGVFYQTGPARWSVGGMNFTHLLDGFGKLHRFSISKGSVSFTSKFPHTGALNLSLAENDLCWGVIAQETSPPRKRPSITNITKAPNDNNNVNPWLMGEHLAVLSDVATLVLTDPKTLELEEVESVMHLKNQSNPPFAPVTGGGSAHPHCADDGAYMGLREAYHMGPIGKDRMAVYKVHPDTPDVVEDIVHFDVKHASYAHSWGLAKGMAGGDHAVVLAQPIHVDLSALLMSGTLQKGFKSTKENTVAHVLSLDNAAGSAPVDIELDHFFFGHFLNTWSPAPGKISFDVNYQSQIFFDRFSFAVQSDKTQRDTWAERHGDAYSTPTRYELDLESKSFTSKKLFPNPATQCQEGAKWCELDLYKLHPQDFGKPYCGFWAQQVFFNSSSFASQAIVRGELCGDEPRIAAAWHRPNTYPGEAQFVPKPGSNDKTEGLLLFKTYEGDTGKSKLVVADAKTLETVAVATIPIRVPFTVHGNWYPTDKAQGGHCIPAQTKPVVV